MELISYILQEWANIQALLRKQHDNNIIVRIKNYTGSITPDIIRKAAKKLRGVDVMEVKHASAGAATFHQWVSIISSRACMDSI